MKIEGRLFREEVISANQDKWLGQIRLAQPISNWLIGTFSIIVSIALILYISFGSINETARITGITVPIGGNFNIVSPVTGGATISHFSEGMEVNVGDVLFTILTEKRNSSGELTNLVGKELATRLNSFKNERESKEKQVKMKQLFLNKRLENLSQEGLQLDHEILLARKREELGIINLAKNQMLRKEGYISEIQIQQKQEELIDIQVKLVGLERNMTQLKANRLELSSELADLSSSLASEAAQIDRNIASLKQDIAENGSRRSVDVIAQNRGIISALSIKHGESIMEGQSMAMIIPRDFDEGVSKKIEIDEACCALSNRSTKVEVQLYAPSRTTGLISLGQLVTIRYSAYPYQKFGLYTGIVEGISKTPFAPSELPPHLASTILGAMQKDLPGTNTSEALYRINVKLKNQFVSVYGKQLAIQPGMTLEADVIQQKKKIWEWIVGPLFVLTARAN